MQPHFYITVPGKSALVTYCIIYIAHILHIFMRYRLNMNIIEIPYRLQYTHVINIEMKLPEKGAPRGLVKLQKLEKRRRLTM